jgi:hypothetical protein
VNRLHGWIAWLRRRPSLWLIPPLLALLGLALWTAPPAMPGYAATRADWRSSEAWLRDRDGRLLDMVRIDYALRRLDWTPLDRIAPALREAVIAGEDKRFAAHDGIDWIGLAGSGWAALRGQHARGASTITMQLAGFLAPELGEPGMRRRIGRRTRSSRPISTSPRSAARRRAWPPRAYPCSASPRRCSTATRPCCWRPCCRHHRPARVRSHGAPVASAICATAR